MHKKHVFHSHFDYLPLPDPSLFPMNYRYPAKSSYHLPAHVCSPDNKGWNAPLFPYTPDRFLGISLQDSLVSDPTLLITNALR